MSRFSMFVVLCACLFLSACVSDKVTFFTPDGYVNVDVRVARTLSEQAKGLMGTTLAENEGMLFVFSENAQRAFWMKDTLVPLDIIYVDDSMTVTEIMESLPPCVADPCAVYPSKKSAQFVVEVNAGFAKAHNIVVGSRMTSTVV